MAENNPHTAAEPVSESRLTGVLRLAAFFVLLAAVITCTHWAITHGLRNTHTSQFGTLNRVMDGQVNADIVISGSSRALVHYDPRVIEKTTGRSAFNIGLNGSQTDMQVALFKAYLRHNRKPKLLVHNLDTFSFVTSKQIYDPAQFMPYLYEDELYRPILKVHPDAWKWKYLPLYGYVALDLQLSWVDGLKAFVGIQPQENQFQGFEPRHLQWTGDFSAYKAANPDGVSFPIEPEGVRDLEDLLATCQREGIHVLLAYSPVYHEMRELERNRDEVFARFHALAARYGAEVIDYGGSDIAQHQQYFYNSQHLNAEGAELFSTLVARDIQQALRPAVAAANAAH
jgi:hypothetical protein